MKNICLILEPLLFSTSAKKSLEEFFEVVEYDGHSKIQYSAVRVLFCRLGFSLNKDFLKKFNDLEFICSPTTGLNHIDVPFCDSMGFKIISLRGETEFLSKQITSTAEFTWALLLATWRRIVQAAEHVVSFEWERDKFRSAQLKGKIIGIVGLGRVGKQVLNYAKAFGAQVIYFDPHEVSMHGKVNDLLQLARDSDIVLILCELNSQTVSLIGKDFLDSVKDDCVIINTARGEIVDEISIVDALDLNKIYYSTDVICGENEQIGRNSILLQKNETSNRCLITPHIGGTAQDAMWLTEEHVTLLLKEKLKC